MDLSADKELITTISGWACQAVISVVRGSDGLVIQADVTRPEQITAMFRKVQARFGSLDIFVSNARPEAPAFFQPPMNITLEQWDAAINCQSKAFLVAVREAVALMVPELQQHLLRTDRRKHAFWQS